MNLLKLKIVFRIIKILYILKLEVKEVPKFVIFNKFKKSLNPSDHYEFQGVTY